MKSNPFHPKKQTLKEISSIAQGKSFLGRSNKKVRNIPTVLVFKDGEVINRQVGVSPKKTYTDAIDAAL